MQEELCAWDECIREGELRWARRTLLRQGRTRFGEPDSETEQEINTLMDLDQLDRMILGVLTTNTWQELLAIAWLSTTSPKCTDARSLPK